MTYRVLHLIIICCMQFSFCAYGSELESHLSYHINVRIEPSTHMINAEVTIRNPECNRFFLNEKLEIQQILADGCPVTFHRDPDVPPIPYTVGKARVLDIEECNELSMTYRGVLPDTVNMVNMVSPDLVELALYATWAPLLEGNRLFDFTIKADLPADYTVVTNGILENSNDLDGRSLSEWKSFQPGSDIVLLASPHLKGISEKSDNMEIELYYNNIPESNILEKKERLLSAIDAYTALYGPPNVAGMIRFVYSPRSGWGYSRIPFFVVSEGYAIDQMNQEYGLAWDFHGISHEIAHFWWNIADPVTPDDWINEGLAEYSAFRLSSQYFGQGFADILTCQYTEHAAQSSANTAIAETDTSSPDRYVNRYEKMTLLYLEASRRFGEDNLDRVFRALHDRYAGTHKATTAEFLEITKQQLGTAGEVFFRDALYNPSLFSTSGKSSK